MLPEPRRAQDFTPDPVDAEAARREGSLSWYTSTPVDLAQQLIEAFQKETGIKVQLLRTGGQAVLRRILPEIAAGQPGADVITMSDAGAANGDGASRASWCAFRPVGFDKVIDVVKDPQGRWIAQRLQLSGIPVRTDKVAPADVPKTWSDLTNPEIQGADGDARPVVHRDPARRGGDAVAEARLGLLQGAARQRHA